MIPWPLVAALALAADAPHGPGARALPWCSNRVVNEVVKRAGCTVGDTWCWYRSGGFCYDYVERRVAASHPRRALRLEPVAPIDVQAGDVAVFASRAHYALVERVVRDRSGRPVAIDVSEVNYGSCWVDDENLVTDAYGTVTRRGAVPLAEADGGFLRPVAAAGAPPPR